MPTGDYYSLNVNREVGERIKQLAKDRGLSVVEYIGSFADSIEQITLSKTIQRSLLKSTYFVLYGLLVKAQDTLEKMYRMEMNSKEEQERNRTSITVSLHETVSRTEFHSFVTMKDILKDDKDFNLERIQDRFLKGNEDVLKRIESANKKDPLFEGSLQYFPRLYEIIRSMKKAFAEVQDVIGQSEPFQPIIRLFTPLINDILNQAETMKTVFEEQEPLLKKYFVLKSQSELA